MGPARAGLVRDTLGSLAVLGVVALTAFGLPSVDRLLPGTRQVAAGTPFAVGGGVSLMPPPYASIDLTRTRPGRDRGVAVFLAGDVRVVVVVGPYRGDLGDAAARVRNKIIRVGSVPAGPDVPVSTDQDVAGRLGAYTTSGRPGTYAVFVRSGQAVEMTVSGPAPYDIAATIRSLTFDSGSGR